MQDGARDDAALHSGRFTFCPSPPLRFTSESRNGGAAFTPDTVFRRIHFLGNDRICIRASIRSPRSA